MTTTTPRQSRPPRRTTTGERGLRAARPVPPTWSLSAPTLLPEREAAAVHNSLGPLRFPVYIPTRGRPSTQLTADWLLRAFDLAAPTTEGRAATAFRPHLVVPHDNPQEAGAYVAANPRATVIPYAPDYYESYERTPELSPHPTTGAAHNFASDHARAAGFSHHWILDDNIKYFWWRTAADRKQDRPAPGTKRKGVRYATPESFRQMEDTATRFANLAGLSLGQGGTFSDTPFMINTRLYCATLYRTDLRDAPWYIVWRRGLNDDTIVSLDILKTGYWCTAESRLLGIAKVGTSRSQRLSGGMTEFYNTQGGFIRKAAEAIRCHPDAVRQSVRFGRVHHHIDYSQFTQRPILLGDTPQSTAMIDDPRTDPPL